jgi:hypothetical protein
MKLELPIACALAVALLAAGTVAQGGAQGRKGGSPPPAPPVPPGPPVPEAIGAGAPGAAPRPGLPQPPPAEMLLDPELELPWVVDERLNAAVGCRTLERRISIAWTYRVPGAEQPSATAQSWIPLSYWPTRVEPVDGRRLAVGGWTGAGETLVEVLELGETRVVAGAPDAAGNPTVLIEPGALAGSSEVYRAATPGRTLVCALLALRGRAQGVLVQFWDSSDVYALDWGTGALEILLSPRADAALPAEPRLAERRPLATSGLHAERGACYMLGGGAQGVAPIMLCDEKVDGTLDVALVIGAEDWRAQGWGEPARWSEVPPFLGRAAPPPTR